MKIVTVVTIILALVLGIIALSFAIDSSQSPLAQDNSTNISITSKVENRDKLSSISDHSLEVGALPLVGTIEDGVYQMNNYSEFYTVSQDGFERVNEVKTLKIAALVSGETCELEVGYAVVDGRVVGGGKYEKIIEQNGVYSLTLSLRYTLTEMPSALKGEEGEKLLLVGYAADDYYSEAFAVSLDGSYSRNLFAQPDKDNKKPEGYVMLTDELVKNSDEYLYFFSTRLYDRAAQGDKFNVYKNIDLFRTRDGVEELVAKHVHHNYVLSLGDKIRFLRSEYAMMSTVVGSVPVISFQEMGFEIIELALDTMEETVVATYADSFSSGYRRFDNMLVRLSPDHYGQLEVYNMTNGRLSTYDGMKMRTVSAFDVSADGRYIIVGGYVSTVSTVNQSINLIDTVSDSHVNISGKELFLSIDGNFGFVGPASIITSDYNDAETKITLYVTRAGKIKEAFKESVEDY